MQKIDSTPVLSSGDSTLKRLLLVLYAVLWGTLVFAADALPVAKRVQRGLEVLVTADAIPTPEGFRPKPGKPIHFLFSQTRQSLGEAIGGIKLPDPALIEQAVVAELSKQGFVRAEIGGPVPEIFILAIVGEANFEEPIADEEALASYLDTLRMPMNVEKIKRKYGIGVGVEELTMIEKGMLAEALMTEAKLIRYRESPRFRDQGRINALVGIEKMTQAYEAGTLNSSNAERLAWASKENRYYLSLNAYDAERWRNKERVLLWRTTMLIDWRKNLTVELPNMLAHAGPLFGTDVAIPTFVDERTRARAEVSIGELKVVPEKPAAGPEANK